LGTAIAAVTLAAGMTTALVAAPAYAADATTRYVSASGADSDNDCSTDGNPCGTIQHAVDQADAGDTISIGAGTFDQNVEVTNDNITITVAFSGSTTLYADTAKVSGVTINASGTAIEQLAISGFSYGIRMASGADTTVKNVNASDNRS